MEEFKMDPKIKTPMQSIIDMAEGLNKYDFDLNRLVFVLTKEEANLLAVELHENNLCVDDLGKRRFFSAIKAGCGHIMIRGARLYGMRLMVSETTHDADIEKPIK